MKLNLGWRVDCPPMRLEYLGGRGVGPERWTSLLKEWRERNKVRQVHDPATGKSQFGIDVVVVVVDGLDSCVYGSNKYRWSETETDPMYVRFFQELKYYRGA
eukprot:3540968-Lingulodinium_polyedra.AAC.1